MVTLKSKLSSFCSDLSGLQNSEDHNYRIDGQIEKIANVLWF